MVFCQHNSWWIRRWRFLYQSHQSNSEWPDLKVFREKGRVIGIPHPALQLKTHATRYTRAKARRKVGVGGGGEQEDPTTGSMTGAARTLQSYLIHAQQAAFRETGFSFISFLRHHWEGLPKSMDMPWGCISATRQNESVINYTIIFTVCYPRPSWINTKQNNLLSRLQIQVAYLGCQFTLTPYWAFQY